MASRGRAYPLSRLRAWFDDMPYPVKLAKEYFLRFSFMTGTLAGDFPHELLLPDWSTNNGSGIIDTEASWEGASTTVWTARATAEWRPASNEQRWEVVLTGGGVTLAWSIDRGGSESGQAITFLFLASSDPALLQPLAATSTSMAAKGW